MLIIAKTKTGFLVKASEQELKQIAGIDQAVPISGDYAEGKTINVAPIWEKLKTFKDSQALEQAKTQLRKVADDIEDLQNRMKGE